MAKSIRSKFKRKMRALKREKLAPRVQKKLIATVSRLNDAKAGPSELLDPDMVHEVDIREKPVPMDVDGNSRLNLKTLRLPNGGHPIWVSQRKLKKKKAEMKIKQKAKKNRAKRNR